LSVAEAERTAAGLGLAAGASACGVALSWVCCLPVALGGIGASAAGFGLALSAWRPHLTALSVSLLGAALWIAHHKADREAPPCARPAGRFLRRSLWGIAVITALLLTLRYWGSWAIYWSL